MRACVRALWAKLPELNMIWFSPRPSRNSSPNYCCLWILAWVCPQSSN